MRWFRRAVLVLLLSWLPADRADSLFIEVVGTDGSTGADGEDAAATSISPDPRNDARATGGNGGDGSPLGVPPGDGGSAIATAQTAVEDDSPAWAVSVAQSGRGGASWVASAGGRGGDAVAETQASGSGEVQSWAIARAGAGGLSLGDPSLRGASGAARATAEAHGFGGAAQAEARASGFEVSAVTASSLAWVIGGATAVESRSIVGDPFLRGSLGGPLDAFANAAGHPLPSDVTTATAGTTRVAAAFDEDSIGVVLSLGQLGFTQHLVSDRAPSLRTAKFEIIASALEVSALQEVVIGFMNPKSLGSGFDRLHFRAILNREILRDLSFDELDQALAYFDDLVIDDGEGFHSGCASIGGPIFCFESSLELIFDWTSNDPSSGFGVDLIVGVAPVPELSSVLLVALGLAVLAARTRRRRALI